MYTKAMKIAVVAANGRSGAAFVAAALEAGHYVKAGVHGGHDFSSSSSLEVMNCDATNLEDVARLIKGCDAVVSLIGHTKTSPAYVQSTATTVLLSAMNAEKIRKIVSLTGTGARMPGDTPNLIDMLLNFAVRLIDKKRVVDGVTHLEILRRSSVDWTVLRVLKLTNGTVRHFHLTATGPAELWSSRKEVAEAILYILESGEYARSAPVLSAS